LIETKKLQFENLSQQLRSERAKELFNASKAIISEKENDIKSTLRSLDGPKERYDTMRKCKFECPICMDEKSEKRDLCHTRIREGYHGPENYGIEDGHRQHKCCKDHDILPGFVYDISLVSHFFHPYKLGIQICIFSLYHISL
jgi:hypothetical protein